MTLRVGLNTDAAAMGAAIKQFPGFASARVFGGPGKGIPSWDSPMVKQLRAARVTVHFSFKDWADDASAVAAINAWLDTRPADVKLAILTWHHEPEGDRMDPNEYRRRWVLLAKTVRAHKRGAGILLIPIHTLYPARHKAGDKFNPDWTTWVGLWQQWAPIDSDGKYVGDAMGWDCYQVVNALAYEKAEDFFRIPVGAAHSLGVPLAIIEWGALRIPSDPTGTGRAQYIIDGADYLAKVGAVLVNWWNTTGSAGQNYRLNDTPSAQAYTKIISKFNA